MTKMKSVKSKVLCDGRTKDTIAISEDINKMPANAVINHYNKEIEILTQKILYEGGIGKGVSLCVKSVAGADIGRVVFKVVFYDIQGDVLDNIEYVAQDINKDRSAVINIEASKTQKYDVKSYLVELTELILTPIPKVEGNDKIVILRHVKFYPPIGEVALEKTSGIDIAIKNVSDDMIASALFNAVFLDSVGDTLDVIQHTEIELRPHTSRTIHIQNPYTTYSRARSYHVTIPKMVTADVEKVHLTRHEIQTNPLGEYEISGYLRNISNRKTDIALVATFLGKKSEMIAVKVLPIKNIEPDTIREFHLKFNPPNDEFVSTYKLNIGEFVG